MQNDPATYVVLIVAVRFLRILCGVSSSLQYYINTLIVNS